MGRSLSEIRFAQVSFGDISHSNYAHTCPLKEIIFRYRSIIFFLKGSIGSGYPNLSSPTHFLGTK